MIQPSILSLGNLHRSENDQKSWATYTVQHGFTGRITPDPINLWKSNPNNFHCDPNGERKQYTVQCMEEKVGSLCGWNKMNYRLAISVRERGRTPTQRLVKRFIPPSCMRKMNGQDPREWEETVPTSWRGEQAWRGSGLLASQSLPQLTNEKLTKGGGDT